MCLPAEQALLLTSLIAGALRHERMDMYQGMSTNMGNMIMYLHSTISPTATISGFSPGHRAPPRGRWPERASGFPCSPLLSGGWSRSCGVSWRNIGMCGSFFAHNFLSNCFALISVVQYSARIALSNKLKGSASSVPTGHSISTLLLHHSFLRVTSPLVFLQPKKKVNASDNKLINVAYHREHPFPSRVSFLSKFLAKINRRFTTVSPLLGFVRTFQFGLSWQSSGSERPSLGDIVYKLAIYSELRRGRICDW